MALTKVSGSILKDPLNLGEVSIGGTLTYQDVTNVDSLGIGTFRAGINVSGGQLDVGSNIKLGNAGVVTCTGLDVNGDADIDGHTELDNVNIAGIVTVSSDGINAGILDLKTGNALRLRFSSGGTAQFRGDTDPIANFDRGSANSTNVKWGYLGADRGIISSTSGEFRLTASGTTPMTFHANSAERLRIGSAGQIGIAGANYGTSGQVLTSGGSGSTVSWSTISTDLVSDTSPQLGGNLDTNSHEISLDTSHAINFGDSNELRVFYHSGNGQIDFNGNTSLQLKTPANKYFQVVNRDNGNNIIQAQAGGNVQIYHAGSKKFETSSTGFTCSGTLNTSAVHTTASQGAVTVASGGDMRLANGSWTGDYAGKIQHANNRVYIQGGTDTYGHVFRDHGGGDRLYIDSNGHVLPADDNTYDLGLSTKRWRNLYTTDLQLSNKGSTNDVDGTWGNYTIQEGESDLFLINNRNGKKYKFNLTEVS